MGKQQLLSEDEPRELFSAFYGKLAYRACELPSALRWSMVVIVEVAASDGPMHHSCL
jgi:hypothetical protein